MSLAGRTLPHQAGHSTWTETEVGARYGQGGSGDRRRQEPIWSFRSKTPLSCLEGTQAVAIGQAQVRLTQLLAVFFLLGSFPKQTRRGGRTKGGGGEMPGQVAPPGSLQTPPERAPFPAGDLSGQNPTPADDPKPGLLGMEKHFVQPQETVTSQRCVSTHKRWLPSLLAPTPPTSGARAPQWSRPVSLLRCDSPGFMLQGRWPGPLLGGQERPHCYPLFSVCWRK